jgi:plasmid stability protein
MGQVLVRNLDDHVVDMLKARAEQHGYSLEQELRLILTAAARPTPLERVAAARRIRALGDGRPRSDSTQLVREDRDAR